MTVETLRDVLSATPFRPFTFHTADGKSIRVGHRECVAYYPEKPRTVVVIDIDGRTHFLEMLLIADLEVDAAATSGRA